ncbi:unnamed protein product [Haemonchus placei]|uniref:Secreted protein n=1 Tax=Haemonchus placei TaxID=6290 RepID=A0A0N4WFZ1_HAEPC|nr:unnamed protein product [Haemonchus placei]
MSSFLAFLASSGVRVSLPAMESTCCRADGRELITFVTFCFTCVSKRVMLLLNSWTWASTPFF